MGIISQIFSLEFILYFSLLSESFLQITDTEVISWYILQDPSVQFSHIQLCDPMDGSMPGFPVPHQLLESGRLVISNINAI